MMKLVGWPFCVQSFDNSNASSQPEPTVIESEVMTPIWSLREGWDLIPYELKLACFCDSCAGLAGLFGSQESEHFYELVVSQKMSGPAP